MLLLGHRTKLTSWAFLLAGSFLYGIDRFYIPDRVCSKRRKLLLIFLQWGPYTETNMRVTDCGCFGDFIKLVPKISFFKDLVLLVPAFYFVFRHKDMHQLFTPKYVLSLIWVVTTVVGTVLSS